MKSAKYYWEVVCPDKINRHYPYFNYGDAKFDAKIYDGKEGCAGFYPEPSPLELENPPCKQRGHSVRKVSIEIVNNYLNSNN